MQGDTILLAEIDRPRGLKGEVVATLHADEPGRLDTIATVWIVGAGGAAPRETRLEGWKISGGRVVLKLEGIDTVEQAREVRGAEVRIRPSEARAEPPDGRWFAYQIEGLEVVTTSGRPVGKVARLLTPAGQTLLEVAGPAGKRLIPFVAAICVRIDLEAGRIVVDPPEGLMDLDAV